MKWRLGMVVLFLALWASAARLLLVWEPVSGADGYRVYVGPGSRNYTTNWAVPTNEFRFTVPDLGQWWFAVRSERGVESGTNFAASELSNEVMFELLPSPVVASENTVGLRPVIECSTNLFSWSSVTGAATWLPATNAQEFFRTRQLVIERVNKVEAEHE